MINKKKYLYITLSFFLTMSCGGQKKSKPAVESFERESVLNYYNVKNGDLSLNDRHKKFGKKSLKWQWSGESEIITTNFKILSKEESPLKYGDFFPSSPVVVVSLYNEVPQKESLKVSYLKEGKEAVWFPVSLNFYGWRTIQVPFFEMEGNSPKKGEQVNYDSFRISTTSKEGTLYLDDIVFSQYQDDRNPYQDEIVPFVKKNQEAKKDHWMPLITNLKRIKEVSPSFASKEDKKNIKEITKFIDSILLDDYKTVLNTNEVKQEFASFQLSDDGKTIVGPPLTFAQSEVYFDKNKQGKLEHNKMRGFGSFMKKLAVRFLKSPKKEKNEFQKMFIKATRYVLDQGWQAGASGGTRHHIGYAVKEIAQAFYLMRTPLKEAGLLKEVGLSMQWLFNLGSVLGDSTEFHVNIDYLNTQCFEHLMLVFLGESPEKQIPLLKAYSKYMSIILAQQNEQWGFKVDGTSWHHDGHYPAYGMGAFLSVPKVIRALSKTSFKIEEKGHQNFKKALLLTREYSHKFDFGFGNAGRHPFSKLNTIKNLKTSYFLMANAGNPTHTSVIDEDFAGAYLSLWGEEDFATKKKFSKKGISEAILPSYKTLPYAATAVHRKDNWTAIIKGYSKYVWASEIYIASNRYGRYPANGTIQLLNEKGEIGSGFVQEGWDWNRYPGATIIYLPIEELETQAPLLMFRSTQSFAGAVTLNGNGVFGMILDESSGSNTDGATKHLGFPGKLKAKKSVFSFGKKLICIGTNISSIDTKNPVETNLFQSFLMSKEVSLETSSGAHTEFPYNSQLRDNENQWVIDPYGNGYVVLSNSLVYVDKKTQNSYHNKYSLLTGKMNPKGKGAKQTKGNFSSAWINHGIAPDDASYSYVIYPFLSKKERQNFSRTIKEEDSYTILRADSIAHVVLDKASHTTGYSVFKENTLLEIGVLKKASSPILALIKKEDKGEVLEMSFVQPDLNFLEYEKFKYKNYSRPSNVLITLNGIWKITENKKVKNVIHTKSTTQFSLECKDGISVLVEGILKK